MKKEYTQLKAKQLKLNIFELMSFRKSCFSLKVCYF